MMLRDAVFAAALHEQQPREADLSHDALHLVAKSILQAPHRNQSHVHRHSSLSDSGAGCSALPEHSAKQSANNGAPFRRGSRGSVAERASGGALRQAVFHSPGGKRAAVHTTYGDRANRSRRPQDLLFALGAAALKTPLHSPR